MKKNKVMWIVLAAAAVAAVAVLLVMRWGAHSEPSGYRTTEVGERMANPEYVAKLDNLRQAQKNTFREISAARKAYLAAKEAGADEAEVARLKAAWEQASTQLATQQQAAELVVRDEMLRQQEEAARNAKR